MANTVARTYDATRTLTQTVTLTDAVKLGIARFMTEATTAIDALTRQVIAIREIAQGSGGYVPDGYTSSGYLVDNETNIVETLARVRDVPRTISEGQVTLSEVLGRQYAALRTIARTITITESLARQYAALRTLTQTVTNVNTVTRMVTALRTITETSTITELIVAFKGIAGVGARRIFEAATSIFKRTGATSIFKRSGNTST